MSIQPIFDNKRRLALRDRAARRCNGKSFLWQFMAEEIADRLAAIPRNWQRALLIGPIGVHREKLFGATNTDALHVALSPAEAEACDIAVIDEDRLPFENGSFDLIISAGTLDSVNDLPGTLVQVRRALRPDGLFLATLFAAGSLRKLKAALLVAEANSAAAHIHPQIDLRAAAELLVRAGFALPVADRDIVDVRYASWRRLVDDLRDLGVGNALSGPRGFFTRNAYHDLDAAWRRLGDASGKTIERFEFIQMTGWAPADSQPKAARRGSATVSLADILPSRLKLTE